MGVDLLTAITPSPLTAHARLERLVAFASISNRPSGPIADFVANDLASTGCRIWRQEYDDGRKVNLLIRRGPERDGGLLLSGHLDVVPADEPDWDSDPFRLTERDSVLHARGAADMKGFIALACTLLAEMRDDDLSRPLALLLTSDEEIGSLGAQHFAKTWRREFPIPEDAIVGEPTGMRVVRMHKGHLKLRVRAHGKPAHSGYPHLGENAIERIGPAIEALSTLAREWRSKRAPTSDHFPECPHPVLNLGTISGGSAVNIVPEACILDLGVRLLPGQNTEEAVATIQARLDSLAPDIRNALELSIINDSPPMLCDKQAPANLELSRKLQQSDTVGVSFASDAGTLHRMGIRTVLWGPGRIEDAHRANEGLAIDQFLTAERWLAQFARRFCCDPDFVCDAV